MVNAKWIPTPRSSYEEFMYTEAHVNRDLLEDGCVIKRAILNAGSENLVFKCPQFINPAGVVEFLSNLDHKTLKMKILL